MKKIIKEGKPPTEKPKITKCSECRTIFSYMKEDTHSDRDGNYVICPVCGKFLNTSK